MYFEQPLLLRSSLQESHELQFVAPGCENVPLSQPEHDTLPFCALKLPAKQGEHGCPMLENFPAAQTLQLEA